jgi:regulator of sigma E protease
MSSALTAIVSMLIVLGIMVLVHEFGHFAVAKLCGVRVEVFSIGFGKRLIGFRRGDTDYRLCLLPLGGYVKMAGETPGEEKTGDPGEFSSHPRWQRILIGLAGPVSNFILAFVLMSGLYMMHNEVENYLTGPAITDFIPQDSPADRAGIKTGDLIVRFDKDNRPTWEQVRIRAALDANSAVPVTLERVVNGQKQEFHTQLYLTDISKGEDFEIETIGLLPKVQDAPLGVREITPGNPADKAGMKSGDAIVSINGQTVHSVAAVTAFLQQTQGKPVNLVVQRKDQSLNMSAQPIWGDDGTGRMGWRLGFRPGPPAFHVEQLPLSQALKQSATYNLHISADLIDVIKRLVTRRSSVQQLSGPVGIARATGEAVTMPGWQPIIGLMALISLNLGIFNLLPIPILDGGMILMLLIESVMRRDLNQEFKERVYQVAFVVLILFGAFVIFNDVAKLNVFSKLKP